MPAARFHPLRRRRPSRAVRRDRGVNLGTANYGTSSGSGNSATFVTQRLTRPRKPPGSGIRPRNSGSQQTRRWRETDSNPRSPVGNGQYLFVDVEKLVVAKVVPGAVARRCTDNRDIAGRIGGTARPGWLAFAPNGRQPRLLMPRQSRRAVVMAHFHEAGRGDVIAPSLEIEEAGIAVVAQALRVIPSRI
jgi:hypothetical protein